MLILYVLYGKYAIVHFELFANILVQFPFVQFGTQLGCGFR